MFTNYWQKPCLILLLLTHWYGHSPILLKAIYMYDRVERVSGDREKGQRGQEKGGKYPPFQPLKYCGR